MYRGNTKATMQLHIAGICFSIEFDVDLDAFKERVRTFFARFTGDDEPPDFIIQVTQRPAGIKKTSLIKRRDWLYSENTRSSTYVAGPVTILVSWITRKVSVHVIEDPQEDVSVLKNVLRMLVSFGAILKGGVPLHCSALIQDDTTAIFMGPEESGKSTIAGLLQPRWALLNDEYNIALPESGSYILHPTPFRCRESEKMPPQKHGGLVLFAIAKAPANAIVALRKPQAFHALLKSTYSFPATDALAQKLFDNIGKLCTQIPVYQLSFKKCPSVCDTVNEFILKDPGR